MCHFTEISIAVNGNGFFFGRYFFSVKYFHQRETFSAKSRPEFIQRPGVQPPERLVPLSIMVPELKAPYETLRYTAVICNRGA